MNVLPKILFLAFTLLQGAILYAQDDLNIANMMGRIDSANIFLNKEYYTWGASVIEGEDGKFHMFYSRWPHGKRRETDDSMNHIFDGFKGWNKYSEIAYAVADKITGPYRHVTTVLKGTGDTARWDRFTFHNPHIRKFDGHYYLYFISNSFDPLFNLDKPANKEWLHWLRYNCTQKIGVVKARTIEDMVNGRFQPAGNFLVEPDNRQTFEVATNPSVTKGPDDRYYMMYKSRKKNVGNMTFWMATADKPDGPFTTVGAVFTSAEMACEDPVIWYDKKRKRFYAAAKYYSNAKKLAPQFGALVLITSENGLDWQPATHSLISLRHLKFSNGDSTSLAHLERPFVVINKKGQPVALFAAASVNSPTQGDVDNVTAAYNTFNVHIPLKNNKPR